jgi:hypothetical protein
MGNKLPPRDIGSDMGVLFSDKAQSMVDNFDATRNGGPKKSGVKTSGNLVKLDDLADCPQFGLGRLAE